MASIEMNPIEPNAAPKDAIKNNSPSDPQTTTLPPFNENITSKGDPLHKDNGWHHILPTNRRLTMLPNARPSPRPFTNKYFFKRPRLLQYYSNGALIDSRGRRLEPTNPDLVLSSTATTDNDMGNGEEEQAQEQLILQDEGPEEWKIQRDWLNLFIDLLWVGIISNISSVFVASAFSTSDSNEEWGFAFLEFIVLFQTAFRFWSYIRKFLNNFFNKDFSQSVFLTWVLVLALFFGNQTPYFLDPEGGRWIIGTFLIAKASFVTIEGAYCWFIPELRKEFRVTFLIAVPAAALWSVSVVVPWPTQAALILPAVVLEGLISAIMSLPLGDKYLLRGAPKKALDPENFVERLQGFFIIVLGEGVYGLISTGGSGWGVGLTNQVASAIEALIVYYLLFWMFFTGDQTKTYIHAIYRNRYTSLAFQFIHVLLFASILLLDASIKYLIQNGLDTDKSSSLLRARWTISAALSCTVLLMTGKSLLNRSLDPPGTLVINSRYLRMVPRFIVCIVTMCLPIVNDFHTTAFLGVIVSLLQTLTLWEYLAAMEKGFLFFEPKNS